ncbi:MAG: EamA family transporter [Verrucomicrobiae bacterium]|nr:EamA family transporter [Verrucomicrobiae bacterium]
MNPTSSPAVGNTWFYYTLITVFSWGVYGILLHKGQVTMNDPVNGRYKAFLFVGIAYFLTAVLAPLVLLIARGAAFSGYTTPGWSWSLLAGILGAIGAFGTLLAFGARGTPAVVMSIVFAGAPVVNALVSLWLYRHDIDFARVNPAFYLGIVLAVVGGGLVMKYKPNPIPMKPAASQPAVPASTTVRA